MKRRLLLAAAAATAALRVSAAIAQSSRYLRLVPASRVIVDNDFAGDPDGLVALAHQLLSPKARTVLVTSSALDPKLAGFAGLDVRKTAQAGTRLVHELLKQLNRKNPPPVVTGAESFGNGDQQASAAARAIVAEAMRDDPLPLVLTCGGPLTNVAAALRLEPRIATRMTLVWIGGSSALDGGAEYNLSTDLAAARHVLEASALPVWQVPEAEYKRFQVSVAELATTMRTASPAGRWLYRQYQQLPPFVQLGGSLTLGDSPMVSLTVFAPELHAYETRTVRKILDDYRYGEEIAGRQVHLVRSLDVRLNYEDFFALLKTDGLER
ncbi:MAG TPA: nucleoside hydrolase [Pseudoduganella sp.]|jgi:hypothetical protein